MNKDFGLNSSGRRVSADRDGKENGRKRVKTIIKSTKTVYKSDYSTQNNFTRTNDSQDRPSYGQRPSYNRYEGNNRNENRYERSNERNEERSNLVLRKKGDTQGDQTRTFERKNAGGYSSENRYNSPQRGGYNNDRPYQPNRRPENNSSERRSYSEGNGYNSTERRPYNNGGGYNSTERRPYNNDGNYNRGQNSFGTDRPRPQRDGNYDPNAKYSKKKQFEYAKREVDLTKPLRLNKFLANAGICSRREADEYIQAGVITVNGEVITELGSKVLLTDKVLFHDQAIRSERKVYLLLNKPKDCVTTTEDTHDRKTVLDIVKNACSERIYPVGRLDRNTTGVLLLTNDGDLAAKLTHPKFEKKKIYHAILDKELTTEAYNTIMSGIRLDDELIKVDSLEFVNEDDMTQIGIEIHSGQNRVVRRLFEKVGYKVVRLDRVFFAGLTKKNLPRGKYRFLTPREVNMLLMGAFE